MLRRALALALLAVAAFGAPASAQGGEEDAPSHVLVVNDDGVRAPGIDALVEALLLRADVRVTVVAPAEQRSGTGGSTTPGPLDARRTRTLSGYPAWGVDGFPADAVRYALDTVLPDDPPDLVMAGINEGANLSPVYDHSGTVGAARAAARRGFPALATSQGRVAPGRPTSFRDSARLTMRWLAANRDALEAGTATSLNTPSCTRGRVREIVASRAAPPRIDRPARRAVDCTRRLRAFPHDVAVFQHGFAPLARLPLEPRG
ncbi:MAG TPA: 5'/3'-nucleotidase SurE [Capillimicrobium sp.]|jgi:5'-nucleotidase